MPPRKEKPVRICRPADFFEWDGTTVGAQVINGKLISLPTNRSVFGVTIDKIPFTDILNWTGYIYQSKNAINMITGLNTKRNSHKWHLYNSYYTHDTLSVITGTSFGSFKKLSDHEVMIGGDVNNDCNSGGIRRSSEGWTLPRIVHLAVIGGGDCFV